MDMKIASESKVSADSYLPGPVVRKLLYIGRGGHDMARKPWAFIRFI